MMSDKKLAAAARLALSEAARGVRLKHGGPFGAAVLDAGGQVIGRGHNTVIRDNDPTAHAEVRAIRQATKKIRSPRLRGGILVTTSEPCPLCLAAAYWAGLQAVYFAVPRAVARRYGFADDFIYQELSLAPGRRRLKGQLLPGDHAAERQLFAVWKKAGGQRY